MATLCRWACACALVWRLPRPASAQIVEAVGSRAQGMGGAFVAVANDSSATWWNPAGLADGPFLDMALARRHRGHGRTLPARRTGVVVRPRDAAVRFQLLPLTDHRHTAIRPYWGGGRQPRRRRAGVPVRSLSASQLGVTLLHTLVPGVHAGTTLKYVRGTLRGSREDGLLPRPRFSDLGEDSRAARPRTTPIWTSACWR